MNLLLAALCGQLLAGEGPWLTDMTKALEQAKTEQKTVLIDFTGSDWCGFCIKLDKEVFETTEFGDYAKKNLVLVKADFPRRNALSAELKAANEALKAKYATPFKGYPTIVLVDANGKKLGETVGYRPGSGSKDYLAKLDQIRKK